MAVLDTLDILIRADSKGLASDIEKATTTLSNAFSKALKGTSGELDFNALFNKSFSTINWTSLISKLFAPANLIAFFSAMAATGIISSIQSQSAGAAAGGATGQTSPAQTSAFGSEGLALAGQLGTAAGSASDYANALATVNALLTTLGISTANTIPITTELIQAIANTGGTISADLTPAINYLQDTGASTSDQIEQVIGNIESAANAAGGALGANPMLAIINDTDAYIQAAKGANVSITGMTDSINLFGATAAVSVNGAKGQIDILTAGLTNNLSALAAMGISYGQLVSGINADTSGTFNLVTDNLGKTNTATLDLLASQLDIPEGYINAIPQIQSMEGEIDNAAKKVATLSGSAAMAQIQAEFDQLNTASRQLSEVWPNIESAIDGTTVSSSLTDLLTLINKVLSSPSELAALGGVVALLVSSAPAIAGSLTAIGAVGELGLLATTGAVGVTAGVGALVGTGIGEQLKSSGAFSALGSWLESLNNPAINSFLGINTQSNAQATNSSSNSSANVKVTVSSAPGTTAVVSSQQNGVSSMMSTAGVPASSNVTVTNK